MIRLVPQIRLLFAVTLFLCFSCVPAPVAAQSASQVAPTERLHRFLGTASCAASSCHGGARIRDNMGVNGERSGRGFAAYSIWAQKDVHSRAYQTLFHRRAVEMSRALYADPDEYVAPHRDAACLSCHAANVDTPGTSDAALLAASHRFDISDGVGCESCHGAAEHWIRTHTTPQWHQLTETQKQNTGFRSTKAPFVRARVCAECHVGSAGRDVNHDLIAAGHPRLAFEFASSHANLYKHWDENADRSQIASDRSFETQMWLSGQIESSRAALKLLQLRAADGVWPEFAEYSCFSCHHDLDTSSWPRQRRSTGRFPWSSWHYSGLAIIDQAFDTRLTTDTDAFAELMQLMARPYPDRQQVIRLTTALRQEIAGFQTQQTETTVTDQQLITAVIDCAPEALTWDRAAQDYLALTSFYLGLTEQSADAEDIQQSLLKIRQQLAYPKGYDSPLGHNALNDALKAEFGRIRLEARSE